MLGAQGDFFISYVLLYFCPNCTRTDNMYSVQAFTHAASSTREEKQNRRTGEWALERGLNVKQQREEAL